MSKTPRPTEAELAILGALWRHPQGATVREVHADLGERTGYTTILKLMQIMTDKGLLMRDTAPRGRSAAHVYRAAHPEAATQRRLAADLMSRAFGGSARKLVAAALSSRRASPAELDEIRRLIDQMKGDAS